MTNFDSVSDDALREWISWLRGVREGATPQIREAGTPVQPAPAPVPEPTARQLAGLTLEEFRAVSRAALAGMTARMDVRPTSPFFTPRS